MNNDEHVNDGEDSNVKRNDHVWIDISHTSFPDYMFARVIDVVGAIDPTYHLEVVAGVNYRRKRKELYTSEELIDARGVILGKKIGI